MEKQKLTADNMNWGHFASRKRYIKDESGATIGTRYDRLFAGFRPAGRVWLESHYTGDDPVMVFMLGNKNVVFTHRAGDDVVYANRRAGAQAREYIKYYVNRLAIEKGITATTVEVDDFPTQAITRASAGGVESLDDAIAAACGRDISDLGI